MEMTLDEAIKRIDEHNYIHQRKEPRAVHITEALDLAIDTMRKYQQIEQIWDKWHIDMSVKTNVAMSQIGEVLKDGKID